MDPCAVGRDSPVEGTWIGWSKIAIQLQARRPGPNQPKSAQDGLCATQE